jgi:NAD-specific glutamate dehydrogenase
VRLAEDSQIPLDHAARVHSVVESSLGLGELRRLASVEPIGTALQELARSSLAETLGDLQRRVAWRLAVMIQPDDAPSNLEQVLLRSDDVLSQLREIKAQVQAGSAGLLESLAVATRLTGILLKRLPEAPPRLAAE